MSKTGWKIACGALPMTVSFSVAMAQAVPPQAGGMEPADPTTLETIIVTARKREEQLIDVPTAITAVTQSQIDDMRLNDARDLITLVPNAFLQENNAGTARDISIRGVSTPSIFAEPGVAMYVDGVYSSGFISYPTQFYDLERIEVLRGPQGALYGRNAVGGAVNVISQGPEAEFGGSVRATSASLDRTEYEGMLNVPLADKAGLRVVAWNIEQDEGDYFNPLTGDYLDASENSGGRLTLAFNPTDALSIDLIVEQNDGTTGGTYLYFPTAGETKDTVERDTPPVNEYDTSRFRYRMSVDASVGTFTLIAGQREYELDGVEDSDLTGDNPFDLALGQLGKQVTTRQNEVQSSYFEGYWVSPTMGRWTVLAGANYLDESAIGTILTDLSTVSEIFTGGALPATLSIDNDQSVKSWAVYTEATFDVTDKVSVVGSVRYTHDDKDVDFVFTPSALLTGFVGPEQSALERKTFSNTSPGLTVAWSDPDGWRLYGKVQSGFRAGGYNFNVASVSSLPYNEETSINFEVGAKRPFADNKGFFGVSVYQLRQDDVLVPLIDPAAPGPLSGYLANVGEATSNGIELEGTYSPIEGLTFAGSVGYLNAEFTAGTFESPPGTTIPLDGKQVPSSREWTYAFTTAYRRALATELYGLANLVFTHRDDGYQNVQNTVGISDADLLNASLGLEWRYFQLIGFVQNALDDDYDLASGGFRPPGELGVIRATGTTYGVTLRASF